MAAVDEWPIAARLVAVAAPCDPGWVAAARFHGREAPRALTSAACLAQSADRAGSCLSRIRTQRTPVSLGTTGDGPESGSHRTRWWRKPDSNHQSPSEKPGSGLKCGGCRVLFLAPDQNNDPGEKMTRGEGTVRSHTVSIGL
jgi:hypothetical protein